MASVKAECDDCSGTGIYSGFAEGKGFAVVCNRCRGTGCRTILYKDFTKRKMKNNIHTVVRSGMGIMVAGNHDFGGLPYTNWLQLKDPVKFPKGTEMRNYTCPAWFFQEADYKKKPNWKECIDWGNFRDCQYFKKKEDCWKKWDTEQRISDKEQKTKTKKGEKKTSKKSN